MCSSVTWVLGLVLLDPEDENSTVLRNVGNYLQADAA